MIERHHHLCFLLHALVEEQQVLLNVRVFQHIGDVNSRFHTSVNLCEGEAEDKKERGKSLQPLEKQDRDKRAFQDERMIEERRWKKGESERGREGGREG